MSKDFTSGLNALLGGTGRQQQTPSAANTRTDGATAQDSSNTGKDSESNKLIDTIKDEELRAALQAKRYENSGRPRKGSTRRKVKEGSEQVCLYAPTELIEKVREIAFRETLTIKDIVIESLTYAVNKYEKENGIITPNKEQRRGNVKKLFED